MRTNRSGHPPRSRDTGVDPTSPTGDAATVDGLVTDTAGGAPEVIRLPPGQLVELVLDHMRRHPKLDFSPYELARVLRRSHGTIRRHLLRLARQGQVRQTTSRPARFRITV